MTIVLLAAHVSTNVPLELSLRAKSTQLIPNSAPSVVLALMHAQVVLSLSKENQTNTEKPLHFGGAFCLFLLEASHYFNYPKESGIFALMVNQDFMSFLVEEILGLIKISVRMTSQNNVKTCCVGNEIWVHIGIVTPPKMA